MEGQLCIFPENVWELILHNLETSKDAWNIFRAFPQLDGSPRLQKKKHIWLFGLILPHLIPWKRDQWITEKSLLDCRQVCRHWSAGVDNYLENHPNFRAYTPSQSQDEDGFGLFPWNTNTYLLREDFDVDARVRRRNPIYFGGVGFDKAPKILSRFLYAMMHHPPERSPFLARSLSINLEHYPPDYNEGFRNNLMAFHHRYGRHVWYYKIELNFNFLDISSYVTQCLSQLSNLKSLHLKGVGHAEEEFAFELGELADSLRDHLTTFPQLESLRLENATHLNQVGDVLISRHSTQIRRLEMQLSPWKLEYFFPNLTELTVTDIGRSMNEIDGVKAKLISLDAPMLAKLQLKFGCMARKEGDRESRVFRIEDDVFQWLKRFPNLRLLEFGEECGVVKIQEKGTLEPSLDSAPSLQFLSIRSSFGVTFNFLRCLPSLQYLILYVPREPVVIDQSVNPGEVRIREEIQTATIYKSNVWELLTKLKRVTLLVENGEDGRIVASYRYNREDYERHKRQMEMGLTAFTCNEFAPLRKDITDFLSHR